MHACTQEELRLRALGLWEDGMEDEIEVEARRPTPTCRGAQAHWSPFAVPKGFAMPLYVKQRRTSPMAVTGALRRTVL